MSDFVRPACLPPPSSDIQTGALCTVVGWGQLFESGKIFRECANRTLVTRACNMMSECDAVFNYGTL